MANKSFVERSLICTCFILVILCPIIMVVLLHSSTLKMAECDTVARLPRSLEDVAMMSNNNIISPSAIADNCIYCLKVLWYFLTLLFVITLLFVMCNRSDKRLQTKEAILCILFPLEAIRHFIQNRNYNNINMIFALTPFCIIAFFVGYYIYIIMDSVMIAGDISPTIFATGGIYLTRLLYFIAPWLLINIIYLARSISRFHRH